MTEYLKLLHQAYNDLPKLLESLDAWSTKLIDYETPFVERMWTEYEGCRLALHKIHPCTTPLKHVHPWPSAIRVLSGQYEMEVGTVYPSEFDGLWDYALTGVFLMNTGSEYDLTAKSAWHTVRPLNPHSISLMVMGKPWEHHPSMNKQPRPGTLNRLSEQQIESIIQEVRLSLGGVSQ